METIAVRKTQQEKQAKKLPVVIEPFHLQLFKDCTLRHAQRLHKQIKEDLDKHGKYEVLTISEICDVFGISEAEFAAGIRYHLLPRSDQF